MNNIENILKEITTAEMIKMVLSNPIDKDYQFRKIDIKKVRNQYQASKFTQKQVFHENFSNNRCIEKINEYIGNYRQINAWNNDYEYSIRITKKGKVLFSKNKINNKDVKIDVDSHNRIKNYIFKEGEIIEPLIDMGIFTKDGKIISSMYDKYRQINKFIEIIDDTLKDKNYKSLNIIDFGSGKAYLTFILYYYLTKIKDIKTNIIGLDLKEDVVAKCNEATKKYKYDGLKFEVGDISDYKCEFEVDIVIMLHACDVATDYGLLNAIKWGAKMIFAVPCCQHELNIQMKSDNFSIITKYGIAKERISALFTDIIRCNLLEVMSYKTQMLEFIDYAHTPKNILIRATLTKIPHKVKEKMLFEVLKLIDEFKLFPTLYKLLLENKMIDVKNNN